MYSPRDKRGIVWSGSRGLGIGIRVENGRFPPMGGPLRKTGYAGSNERGWRGKTDPPRGRDLVNRKNCFSKKKSYGRKSMLILDQGEIGKGLGSDFVGEDWISDPRFFFGAVTNGF